jgi:hypothetical protein
MTENLREKINRIRFDILHADDDDPELEKLKMELLLANCDHEYPNGISAVIHGITMSWCDVCDVDLPL